MAEIKPIEVIENRMGRKFLRSSIIIENKKQKEMGIKNTEEQEIPFMFDPLYVVCWNKHEFEDVGEFKRTLIELSMGGSTSIGCTVEEFEKVFLSL